jgi:hypothetical protein
LALLFVVTVQTARKIVQKQALSLLIRLFLCYFSRRLNCYYLCARSSHWNVHCLSNAGAYVIIGTL